MTLGEGVFSEGLLLACIGGEDFDGMVDTGNGHERQVGVALDDVDGILVAFEKLNELGSLAVPWPC